MPSESEIDERTETRGVQRPYAEDQQGDGHHPRRHMTPSSKVLIEYHLLDFPTEGKYRQEGEDHSEDERGIELATTVPAEALEVEREHGLVVVESMTDVIRPEQHPADHDQEESGESGKWKVESGKFSVFNFPFST